MVTPRKLWEKNITSLSKILCTMGSNSLTPLCIESFVNGPTKVLLTWLEMTRLHTPCFTVTTQLGASSHITGFSPLSPWQEVKCEWKWLVSMVWGLPPLFRLKPSVLPFFNIHVKWLCFCHQQKKRSVWAVSSYEDTKKYLFVHTHLLWLLKFIPLTWAHLSGILKSPCLKHICSTNR